jgi:hypothetical protein
MKTQTLVERYADDIKGVIECFDRVVLFSAKTHQGRDVLWRAISTLAHMGPISAAPEEGLQPKI